MDCVTCILVGMCVMCGPGIGRSHRGANEPGRPMTEAEVNQALSGWISHFRPTTRRPPAITSTRRQNFVPDHRFTDIGIGKRKRDKTAFQNLSVFLGKNMPASIEGGSEKDMVELLLFGPKLRRGLLDFKQKKNLFDKGGDSFQTYGKSPEDFNEHLNSLSTSDEQTVDSIMKRLKRSKLEELLLNKIAQGSRLAMELEKLRTNDNADLGRNDVKPFL